MKEIKLFEIDLYVDGECFHYDDNQWMDDIHIPDEMKTDLIRHLMCFHRLDLTEAYPGHCVVAILVPPMEETIEDSIDLNEWSEW